PGGTYKLYADVTYETGTSDTLTTSVTVPETSAKSAKPFEPLDQDDSWRVASDMGTCRGDEYRLSPALTMRWIGPERILVNQPVTLQFRIRDASGQPAALEPYLGMRGHLALRREDGSVFTHLHPGGSASMAAMQLAVYRIEGKLPLKAAF